MALSVKQAGGAETTKPEQPVRIAMVAGEASGDILGAGLIKSLRQHFPHCQFEGIGGDLMLAEGFHSFFPQERLAVMGLVEPLKRLPELLRMRRFLRDHLTVNPPDVFIGIDSPDFNLDLELALRKRGIKTAHYVSPSVWAWRQGRIRKIKQAVDLMLTLLPFEADFYRQHGVPVAFVGHPLADKVALEDKGTARARQQLRLAPSKTCIAIMPGSRESEVNYMAPIFFEAARLCQRELGAVEFVIPAANPFRHTQLQSYLEDYADLNIKLISGRSHAAMAAADVVLMTSGTTALEAMLLKRPMVISYRLSTLSFAILSRMVKVEFVGLPNLLAGEQIVPEFLQRDATPQAIATELLNLIKNRDKTEMLKHRFEVIHRHLAMNADESAARQIAALVESGPGAAEC